MTKKNFLLILSIIFITKIFANIELEPSIQEELSADPGSTINIDFLIKNKSEDPMDLKTKIDLPEDWHVLQEIEDEFNLEDQKLVSYSIEIPKNALSETYPIEFSTYDRDDKKVESYTSNIKITPSKEDSKIEEKTKPIMTSFSYDFNKADSKLFLESNGSKFIDQDKKNNFEFALKVPVTHEDTTLPTKIDGKPEKFYLGYITPRYSAFLGDKDYKVSPLTITPHSKKSNTPAPLGRGSLVSFNRKNLGFGFLYLIKPPFEVEKDQSNLGGFLSYKVLGNKIALAVVNTSIKKPDADQSKNSLIYSIRSNYEKDGSIYDFEYANTSFEKNRDAYLVKIKDKLLNIFSYNFEGLYARPNFSGYLSDRSKIDTSADLALTGAISTGGAYKVAQSNLEKAILKKSAVRETSYHTKITHKSLFDLSSTLSFENFLKKDLLKDSVGHKLNKFKFLFKQPIKKYTFESTLEKGIYQGRDENYLKRDWHNMHLNINYDIFKNQSISAYTKLGNFIDADLFNVGYVYGLKTAIKQNKSLNLSLLYEYTHFRRKSSNPLKSSVGKIKNAHKIDSSLNWTFPTSHELKFKAKFDPKNFSKDTTEVGLSYSIPYDVPWFNN
ncbi:MAG: hypothetical protein K1000chlam1_00767 [Candidatus Anoxychlamydiales bacterium]|nr:hypothetical protein [Candidatus Anoxychlamydiales bacterium]